MVLILQIAISGVLLIFWYHKHKMWHKIAWKVEFIHLNVLVILCLFLKFSPYLC